MTKTQELLRNREIQALRITIIFRVITALYALPAILVIAKSGMERVVSSILLGLSIVLAVLFLLLLFRKKHITLIGVFGAVLDALLLAVMPLIWYLSVGGPPISPAYMIKGPVYIVYLFVFIVIHSLAIRPAYVVVHAGLSFGGLSAITLYIFLSGKAHITSDFVSHNLGPGVSPAFVLSIIVGYVITTGALILFTVNIRKTIHAAVKNETTAAQLSRYFSPKVRSEIMSEEKRSAIAEGKQQNVAVLFSDIRNFTRFCEEKSPKEVLSFLKEYHERMVKAIFAYSGTLDKFIGDGILATFGTPDPSEEDAKNAVNAARAMCSALADLNNLRLDKGLSTIAQGIGIHYGPVIVGNIGSAERLEYTVIGDTVNISSRLESATKELHEQIIISSAVAEKLDDSVILKPKGAIILKGRNEPVDVFAVSI